MFWSQSFFISLFFSHVLQHVQNQQKIPSCLPSRWIQHSVPFPCYHSGQAVFPACKHYTLPAGFIFLPFRKSTRQAGEKGLNEDTVWLREVMISSCVTCLPREASFWWVMGVSSHPWTTAEADMPFGDSRAVSAS